MSDGHLEDKLYYLYDQYGENLMDPIGPVGIIPLRGSEELAADVNAKLYERRLAYHGYGSSEHNHAAFLRKDYRISTQFDRYCTGEGRVVINDSIRGHDVFVLVDVLNHSCEYKLFGKRKFMTPDEHYQDLKRVILAISGRARRVNVIMPFLYDSRQHHRSGRESLDCAYMLEELHDLGVNSIITFDAHDPRVANAIPVSGFENISAAYQIIKGLKKEIPTLGPKNERLVIISPDEGALERSMFFANMLGAQLGTYFKRRDFTKVVNGRNPILKHEFLGDSVEGMDVLIIDDMIASGESMLDICRSMKEMKARNIYCAGTFALFTAGLEAFNQAYRDGCLTRLISTNLIYRTPELRAAPWFREVSLSKFIALLIDAMNHDSSLSTFTQPTEKIETFLRKG